MAQAEFSLQEKDKKRLIKDRLVRFAVTSGGVGAVSYTHLTLPTSV